MDTRKSALATRDAFTDFHGRLAYTSSFFFPFSSGYRAGLRGMELVAHTSKGMLQGAGTFGTFMAIGSAIRC